MKGLLLLVLASAARAVPVDCQPGELRVECAGKGCLRYTIDRAVYRIFPPEFGAPSKTSLRDFPGRRAYCRKSPRREDPRLPPKPAELTVAFALALFVEALIGFVLGLRERKEQLTLLGLNAVTQPLVFLVAAWAGTALALAGLEFTAVIFEAAILSFALKRSAFSAFAIAIGANLASFLAGVAFLWR